MMSFLVFQCVWELSLALYFMCVTSVQLCTCGVLGLLRCLYVVCIGVLPLQSPFFPVGLNAFVSVCSDVRAVQSSRLISLYVPATSGLPHNHFAPQPPSFTVLSAAISASVRSTCLMVCVIHSDCFPTSNAFVLLVLCVRAGREQVNGSQGEIELLCICVCRTLCDIKRAWLGEILLLEFHLPFLLPSITATLVLAMILKLLLCSPCLT